MYKLKNRSELKVITVDIEQRRTYAENEEELNEHGTKRKDPCHQDSNGKKTKHVCNPS